MEILFFLAGVLALYLIYSVIRMAIDPAYNERVQKQAARERARRARKKHVSHHDPMAKNMYGKPRYPEEYERAKKKEWKKFWDSIPD